MAVAYEATLAQFSLKLKERKKGWNVIDEAEAKALQDLIKNTSSPKISEESSSSRIIIKNTSSPKKREEPSSSRIIIFVVLAAVAVGFAISTHRHLPPLFGPRSPQKQYKNWTEFYPFYLSEHQDTTCRILHLFGTLIVTLLVLRKPKTILSSVVAASVGYMLSEALSGLPHGFVEFGIMALLFFAGNKFLTDSYGLEIAIPGYFFAWIGHFFYELNKPASFIYPTYSLMGDYKMTYDILTGALPLRS